MINIFCGALTSFFGWAGGRGDDWWQTHQWFPRLFCQSWVRDWLIPLTCVIAFLLYGVHSWWFVIFFIATLGALSTYWDWLFGYDNFFMHGFAIGIASFPVAIVTGHWWLFLARTLILTVWMGVWSGVWKNVHVEEAGRYFPVGATLFMLV